MVLLPLLLLLAGTPLAGETPPISGGRWEQVASAPTARTEVTAALLEGKIYLIGGLERPGLKNLLRLTVSKRVEIYDPKEDRWEEGPSLPVPLHHAAAAVVDGRLFVIGGFRPAPTTVWKPVDLVLEYLPEERRWVARRSMPTPRGALAIAVLDGKIYAIGGYDGKRSLATVEIYDPKRDSWEEGPPLRFRRDHLAAAALDGKLYAIGGRIDLSYRQNLSVVELFDPEEGKWREIAPLPTARSGMAAAVLRGMVLVVGGEGPQGTFEENEAYWPVTGKWYRLPPLPTPRHGLAAVAVSDRLYAIAGGPRPGGSYSRMSEVFIPD